MHKLSFQTLIQLSETAGIHLHLGFCAQCLCRLCCHAVSVCNGILIGTYTCATQRCNFERLNDLEWLSKMFNDTLNRATAELLVNFSFKPKLRSKFSVKLKLIWQSSFKQTELMQCSLTSSCTKTLVLDFHLKPKWLLLTVHVGIPITKGKYVHVGIPITKGKYVHVGIPITKRICPFH